MDGFPALDLWDLIVTVLHGNTNQSKQVQENLSTSPTRKKFHGKIDDLDNVDFLSSNVHSSHQEALLCIFEDNEAVIKMMIDGSGKLESDVHKRHKSHNKIDVMQDIDSVPSNVQSASQEALLYVFEDNEAVIKMIMKGRSPTMRHVSRTHRVALDWLFDRINWDPEIQIKYVDTKHQLADILTKGNFTCDEWNHLLCLFNISHFSSINSLEAMSKRTQEDVGVTAKSKPMMNLVSRCSARNPNELASTASESPGKTKSESQNVPLSSLNVQQTSTERPVHDKFVIDDDMDSDTAAESNISLKSRSFLKRVNIRV